MSSRAKNFLAAKAGSNNEDELFRQQWVDTGIAGEKDRLPDGTRGFNVSKVMRHVGQQYADTGGSDSDFKTDGYGTSTMGGWIEGWAKYMEEEFGHRNAALAMSVYGTDDEGVKRLIREHSEGVEKAEGSDRKDAVGGVVGRHDNAETVLEKVATRMEEKIEGKNTDAGVVQGSTPIQIDPDFISTVRSAAPILEFVDLVSQAGFTASYNVISAREDPAGGWTTEADAMDVSGNNGAAFTLPNQERDMKIWWDLINVSDFASQAQSSLDFMDLEGTSLEVRMQEWATEEAEAIFYGDPDGGLSDGSAHDSTAPYGMYAQANDASTSFTKDKSGVDLSGDKALFEDIKGEILSLVKDTGAQLPNIGIGVSFDMFHAMENEANINVRIDAFDREVNFGRAPNPTTLSILGRPVIPEPNIRDHAYGSGEYAGDIGDVFLFEIPHFQRRSLQSLATTTLGQQGLADRIQMYQYEGLVDKTTNVGEGVSHLRVLEGYGIDPIGA